MDLPEMTPLQALAVSILFDGERSSRDVHDELAFRGVEMALPQLYRMLGRAELAGYLVGKYRVWQTADGRPTREKFYRVTPLGLAAWHTVVAFYDSLDHPPDDFQPISADEFYSQP